MNVRHQNIFFSLRISSTNNGREHRGTTSFTSDPHVQIVSIPDRHECFVYQARFTDAELTTPGPMIYRNVEETLSKSTLFQSWHIFILIKLLWFFLQNVRHHNLHFNVQLLQNKLTKTSSEILSVSRWDEWVQWYRLCYIFLFKSIISVFSKNIYSSKYHIEVLFRIKSTNKLMSNEFWFLNLKRTCSCLILHF